MKILNIKNNDEIYFDIDNATLLTQEALVWKNGQKTKGLCFDSFDEDILIDGILKDVTHISLGNAILKVISNNSHCINNCPHLNNAYECPMLKGVAHTAVHQKGSAKIKDKVYTTTLRYARNINAISVEELHILHTKKVCIVGAGGLGGYITEILSRLGILNITLIDDDVFDLNNLNRQLFSKESLIGHSKVAAAKARISEVNSNVQLNIMQKRMDADNANDIISGHDLVIDALDNIQSRFVLADTCNFLDIPMVHGAIAGWYGQVCCIYPGDKTLDFLYNRNKEKGVETELGNLPFTASTIASLQCAQAVKILTNKGDIIRNSVLQIDLLNGEYTTLNI